MKRLGPLPPGIEAQLTPVPDNFSPLITELVPRQLVAWRGNITLIEDGKRETIPCEIGVRWNPNHGPEGLNGARRELVSLVWELLELGRLGYAPGLAAARQDRHDPRRRPVSKPPAKL